MRLDSPTSMWLLPGSCRTSPPSKVPGDCMCCLAMRCARQQAAGSRQQAAGSRQQAAEQEEKEAQQGKLGRAPPQRCWCTCTHNCRFSPRSPHAALPATCIFPSVEAEDLLLLLLLLLLLPMSTEFGLQTFHHSLHHAGPHLHIVPPLLQDGCHWCFLTLPRGCADACYDGCPAHHNCGVLDEAAVCTRGEAAAWVLGRREVSAPCRLKKGVQCSLSAVQSQLPGCLSSAGSCVTLPSPSRLCSSCT